MMKGMRGIFMTVLFIICAVGYLSYGLPVSGAILPA